MRRRLEAVQRAYAEVVTYDDDGSVIGIGEVCQRESNVDGELRWFCREDVGRFLNPGHDGVRGYATRREAVAQFTDGVVA